MLDPSIIFALDAVTPPARPTMVYAREWVSPRLESAHRLGEQAVATYDRQVEQWTAELHRVRSEFSPDVRSLRPLTPDERGQLDRLIADIEAHAEMRALANQRLKKTSTRDIRRLQGVDPELSRMLVSVADRLHRTDRKAIEALLEHATFLRALRATKSADPVATARSLDDLRKDIRRRAA